MVYKWLKMLQGGVFPAVCRLCGSTGFQGIDLCTACQSDLPLLKNGCRRCAVPLPPGLVGVCGSCQAREPSFDTCYSPYRYGPPLDYLIKRLKFHQDLAVAELLGSLFSQFLHNAAIEQPDVILPVPLHARRLAERGFNQSLEIGRVISRTLVCPVNYKLARRVRETEPQSLLPAGRRSENIRGAFAVPAQIHSKHIAILDDVMTSGATVNELARVLRKAGAKKVDVWVLARAGQ